MGRKRLRVLFAAAEAYPFAKVGGLADVGSALPKALVRLGHEVRLVLPGYPWIERGKSICYLATPLGQSMETVHFSYHGAHQGVKLYTAANERYFGREMIYGYSDDDVRFILFSKALAAFAAESGWIPDIIHANDWHAALVPQYVREGLYRSVLQQTGMVLTIHNLAYQGPLSPTGEAVIGLEDRFQGNLLARGIAFADEMNTVSRRYMEEILTPEYGAGLDALLRARRDRLRGILNGIDYEEFDPSVDRYIPARYDASCLQRKQLNKVALQERSGLVADAEVPLLGMVARLVDQKGFDLLCDSLDGIVRLGAQVVVVGVGDARYRQALNRAATDHHGAIAYHLNDGEELARLVYAGSDLFLAPSQFEPCGLGPLIALRYGSVPIARRTGGLAETVSDYLEHPEVGLGFTFVDKYPEHLLRTVNAALDVYRQRERWEELQRRGMGADFAWDRSAHEYEEMYRDAHRRALGLGQSRELRREHVSA